MADSLIYLPDISGFTNFVNTTEISHSEHIISELLQIIIDSDHLEMEVSEVEGDAVLFYKLRQVPSVIDLISQAENTFKNFHRHLKRYETDRVCQCGACSTAHELTLKIIVHTGEIGFTKVLGKEKPFGPTVVAAHRLLKNDVPGREYLLFTEGVGGALRNSVPADKPWIDLQEGRASFDGTHVDFLFIVLTDLKRSIPSPDPVQMPTKTKNPIIRTALVNAPLYIVYEVVSNLDLRLEWNKDVRDISYEKNRVNRVGTQHRCLFNNGFADFETITNDFGPDIMVYGEKISNVKIADEINVYYILEERETKQTSLQVEFHFKPLKWLGWFLTPFIRSAFRGRISQNIQGIKQVSEQNVSTLSSGTLTVRAANIE